MIFSLENKTAIVTGSSKGNGLAITKGLKDAGAEVIGLDIVESEDCEINSTDEVGEGY